MNESRKVTNMQTATEDFAPLPPKRKPIKRRTLQIEVEPELFKTFERTAKNLGHTFRQAIEFGVSAYIKSHTKK